MPLPTPTPERLFTLEELADALHITPRLARDLAQARRIATVKVGRNVRVSQGAIDEYVAAHTRPVVATR